ncbi:glycosyl hydrolase [Pedobacter psychrophilus]|uniref:Glycosyl hydrolase n=1 Tax=Pedobacter psychrophilus TaxID=1826909 RepID=A0A179DGA0_9SPHI|nr:glycoside hydrolase family 3 C-terminal domain-containing protein [Pedobacter psychrophilus]OAQ39812.1 glycosyl hydrolase [Pedobacter psychrophilus]
MKKQFKLSILLVIITVATITISFHSKYKYPFQDPTLSIENRVDNLVSLLTLEEKVGQMVNNAPAIKRLEIPAYNWWNETLHGVARSPYHVTSYPQAIAMAATWDTTSLFQMANFSALEGRAIYNDSKRQGKTGIYLGLTYWTPNINIFRDPRWGRGQETYGEDPYLTGALGKSFVRGLEGDNPKYLKASACAKHFAVHSGPEWNRSTYNAEVSSHDLWDTYLPAFRDLIVDAKVSGVMCAYNRFEGQPCCGSDLLMNDILRNQFKFTGYVTSDCGGIGHFYKTHKTHPDAESASADAVLHGTDCECSNQPSYFALLKAVSDGKITEKEIDISVKRLFTIRFRLGMFDPEEMVPFNKIDTSVLENKEHQALALKMARQSIVLLKNEPFVKSAKNILPLSKNLKKIAVIGPNAADEEVMLANYYGYPSKISSILEGIKSKTNAQIIYEKGVNLTDNQVFKPIKDNQLFNFNGKNGFQAAYFQNTTFKGEPAFTRQEPNIDHQWGDGEQIADKIIARNMGVRWTANFVPQETTTYTFELKADDGSRLFINDKKVKEAGTRNGYYTFNAEKGKSYKIVLEYWQYSDNAEVKLDLGKIITEKPETIAERVKDADVIIFAGGISARLEGEDMPVEIDGFKGGDRTNIALPKAQTELMKALKATGKPVIFVNLSGSAIGFQWEAANLPAIVQVWYGGQAGGEAIADVLFGDYNPAGRLPITFYKSVDDLPDFQDYKMDNRTYRYFKGEPLYPFGFGLSYTRFKYGNMEVIRTEKDNLKVKVKVTNTGKIAGEEVVQLYLTHQNSDFKTPIRSLKGFKRINLKSGESKTVEIALNSRDLSEVDADGKIFPIKGNLQITMGGGQPSRSMLKNSSVIEKTINL